MESLCLIYNFICYLTCLNMILDDISTDQRVNGSSMAAMAAMARSIVDDLPGSTLVMRAITLNERLALQKAVALTARSQRASQLLYVTGCGSVEWKTIGKP